MKWPSNYFILYVGLKHMYLYQNVMFIVISKVGCIPWVHCKPVVYMLTRSRSMIRISGIQCLSMFCNFLTKQTQMQEIDFWVRNDHAPFTIHQWFWLSISGCFVRLHSRSCLHPFLEYRCDQPLNKISIPTACFHWWVSTREQLHNGMGRL